MANQDSSQDQDDIRSFVRSYYGAIVETKKTSCCAPSQSTCCGSPPEVISNLYQDPDLAVLPTEVTEISLGCGDPVTLAELRSGQTVLDLGSGGGIDCFLAARKVGPAGKVIGVDMTPAMIEKARANQQKLGVHNVEFRLGEIEHLPVDDGVVDVIISNCVINLSPDKLQVFKEVYRVLVPGGRLAASDIVTNGPLPEEVRSSLSAWAGCVAGALDVQDYIQAIEAAGLTEIEITPTYWPQDLIDEALEGVTPDLESTGLGIEKFKHFDPQKAIFSAKITARKPG